MRGILREVAIVAPLAVAIVFALAAKGPAAVQSGPPQDAAAPTVISFDGVSIVDVESGTIRPDMRVEVEGGRITRVEPRDPNVPGVRPAVWQEPREQQPQQQQQQQQQPPPRGGVIRGIVMNARGKFLIPGLWDSHVHLTKVGAGALPAFVAYGVTSVRDMGSDLAEVLQWRREIDAGARPGPRIKTAGQILETPANIARMKREATVEPVDRIRIAVGSPADARAAVAKLADGGADLIKVRTVVNTATLRAIAAAAHARGLKLAGHPVATPEQMIAARMDDVEHVLTVHPLAQLAAAQRRALFERLRDAHMWMGTTTIVFEGSALVPYDTARARLKTDPLWRLVSPYLAQDWVEQIEERKGPEAEEAIAAFKRDLPGIFQDLHDMHASGVRLLAGSDAAVAFMYPGDSLHGELQSLVDHVGLTPAEALRTATINPAAFFGLDRELGSIKKDYRADLVLLDANPLEDIRNTRRIAGIVHNGVWIDSTMRHALLARAASDAQH